MPAGVTAARDGDPAGAPRAAAALAAPLLDVRDVTVSFGRHVPRPCVEVSFQVAEGQVLGVVGASGSGKTMAALAVCGLLPPRGRVVGGSIRLAGEELIGASKARLRELRGRDIGLVFQDAGRALDPVHTIGHHLREAGGRSTDSAALLDRVGLSPTLAARYPHELSGGQRQRAMIAVATARNPRLVLADEPTSSVDSITQVHLLRELVAVQRALGCGLVIISHDLGMITRVADDVVVMDAGRVVDGGPTGPLLRSASHPITRGLLDADVRSVVRRSAVRPGPSSGDDSRRILLDGVTKRYGRGERPAVDDVTLPLGAGETLGLVGESGSGKSTMIRLGAFLLQPDSGRVTVDAVDPATLSRRARRRLRRKVQLAHQDVSGCLDPRQTVRDIVAEPLRYQGVGRAARRARVESAIESVKLSADLLTRRPAQLSGGQRQRVVLARALVTDPSYLLLDEPVSALDATLVTATVELLQELQHARRQGCLVVSHDLGVVAALADRIAVAFDGRIVELGDAGPVFERPGHPYTHALQAAMLGPAVGAGLPDLGPHRQPATDGCHYAPRCPHATDRCRDEEPPLLPFGEGRSVRCWLVE